MSRVISFSKGKASIVIDEYMLCSPVYMEVRCRNMREAQTKMNEAIKKLNERFNCNDVIMKKCIENLAKSIDKQRYF